MTNIPTPQTWVDNQFLTWTDVRDQINGPLSFLMFPPLVKLQRRAAQTITDDTWIPISWDYEVTDNGGMHQLTVNPTRVTPTTAGYYVGYVGTSWVAGTSLGTRHLAVYKNGTAIRTRQIRSHPTGSLELVYKGVKFGVPMNGTTDYLEFVVQNSSGTISTGSASEEFYPELYMRWQRRV